MKLIEVLAQVFHVPNGAVLQLNSKQANVRRHLLEVLDAGQGLYKALSHLQFKKGEILGIHQELSKAEARHVALLGDDAIGLSPSEPANPAVPIQSPKPVEQKTVADLAKELRGLSIEQTIQLLGEYDFKAENADTVIPAATYAEVVKEDAEATDAVSVHDLAETTGKTIEEVLTWLSKGHEEPINDPLALVTKELAEEFIAEVTKPAE